MKSLLAFIFAVAAPLAAQVLGEPASWYGIVPGVSKEPNVVALYGEGRFDDRGGDTGRRTYLLSDGSILQFESVSTRSSIVSSGRRLRAVRSAEGSERSRVIGVDGVQR
jgi:hypothetical protein